MMLVEEGRARCRGFTRSDTSSPPFPELRTWASRSINCFRHRQWRSPATSNSVTHWRGRPCWRSSAETPLDFTPGEALSYSNTGFILLGHDRRARRAANGSVRFLQNPGLRATRDVIDRPTSMPGIGAAGPMVSGYEGGAGPSMPVSFLPARHSGPEVSSLPHTTWPSGLVHRWTTGSSPERPTRPCGYGPPRLWLPRS